MQRLDGVVQNYAWGSRTLLSSLRGEAPSTSPEAELWFGTHESAPSKLDSGSTLLEEVSSNASELLGQSVVDRFGERLPFLLKLLAADTPLSIQAHPSLEQARRGFGNEEAAGGDRSAPDRSFRDDNHKPELICALTRFEALVGFRHVDETQRFFDAVGFPELQERLASVGPKGVVEGVLDPARWNADASEIEGMVRRFVDGCVAYGGQVWGAEANLIERLDQQHPADAGILVAALLNLVTLEPGEALYLGAGTLHAYAGGLAVEIMANSDNVLRGGLTPKHIDVPNLLDIVRPETVEPDRLRPVDGTYQTPAPDFALTVHAGPDTVIISGPAIVLCTRGSVTAVQRDESIELLPTHAIWLPNRESAEVSGNGQFFTATVGATS